MRSVKEDERIKARKKVKEEQKPRPERRRPKSVQDEADAFIAAALSHFASEKTILNKRSLTRVPLMYRNYSANTGLKGDHKRKVWANVQRQLNEAKAEATSDDAEL